MNKLWTIIAGFGVLASIGSAAWAASGTSARDEAAIARLNKHWIDVINAHDVTATAGMYAQDGSLYIPNAPPATGSKAIHAMWQGALGTPGFKIDLKTARLTFSASHDLAVDVGTYTQWTGDAKAPTVEHGKYVVTWIKRGVEWKVFTDMVSPNAPAASGQTAAVRVH